MRRDGGHSELVKRGRGWLGRKRVIEAATSRSNGSCSSISSGWEGKDVSARCGACSGDQHALRKAGLRSDHFCFHASLTCTCVAAQQNPNKKANLPILILCDADS